MMESLIKTMDRQGLFKGDLNIVQRSCLQWLMGQEIEDQIELEKIRIESHALASNQHTSNDFVKKLFEQRQKEESEEEEIQWITPKTPMEMEMLLADLNEAKASAEDQPIAPGR